MHGKEAVLSFDLEENDFLYRVRRDSRIVHVSVLHGDIILPRERTESSLILSHLRGVPKWYENWTTLTVRKGLDGVIQSAVDEFPPHPLNTKLLDSQTPNYFNILILERLHRISDRVSLVSLDNKPSIMKIAKFRHELTPLPTARSHDICFIGVSWLLLCAEGSRVCVRGTEGSNDCILDGIHSRDHTTGKRGLRSL